MQQSEIFEVQAKAPIDPQTAERVIQSLYEPGITITKASERTQYDTYFLWDDEERGRIRIREDHRTDPGARAEPKYTITLMAPALRGEYQSAILFGRARYTARADRTLRFYREYFQPDRIVEIEKRRRRWRIQYRDADFAVNLDTLIGHARPGPYLEIKSRTWSRKDAEHKVELIGELLRRFGVPEDALIRQEYVELELASIVS